MVGDLRSWTTLQPDSARRQFRRCFFVGDARTGNGQPWRREQYIDHHGLLPGRDVHRVAARPMNFIQEAYVPAVPWRNASGRGHCTLKSVLVVPLRRHPGFWLAAAASPVLMAWFTRHDGAPDQFRAARVSNRGSSARPATAAVGGTHMPITSLASCLRRHPGGTPPRWRHRGKYRKAHEDFERLRLTTALQMSAPPTRSEPALHRFRSCPYVIDHPAHPSLTRRHDLDATQAATPGHDRRPPALGPAPLRSGRQKKAHRWTDQQVPVLLALSSTRRLRMRPQI